MSFHFVSVHSGCKNMQELITFFFAGLFFLKDVLFIPKPYRKYFLYVCNVLKILFLILIFFVPKFEK